MFQVGPQDVLPNLRFDSGRRVHPVCGAASVRQIARMQHPENTPERGKRNAQTVREICTGIPTGAVHTPSIHILQLHLMVLDPRRMIVHEIEPELRDTIYVCLGSAGVPSWGGSLADSSCCHSVCPSTATPSVIVRVLLHKILITSIHFDLMRFLCWGHVASTQ